MISGWFGRMMSGSTRQQSEESGTSYRSAFWTENGYRRPPVVIAFWQRVGIVSMLMLVAWAVAAGTWRALDTNLDGTAIQTLLGSKWLALIGGAVFYAAGALGAASLILLAAGLIGGIFGFLFGLPRMSPGAGPTQVTQNIQTGQGSTLASDPTMTSQPVAPKPDTPPAGRGSSASSPATATRTDRPLDGAGPGFRMSPALTEIADWLTKIIVGLGLVQAREIGAGFQNVMFWLLGPAGLERFPAAGVVVPACMIIGLIGGFILMYLVITLVFAAELAEAAYDLDTPRVRQERTLKEQAEQLAREEARLRGEAEQSKRDLLIRQRATVVNIWREVDLLALASERANVTLPPITPAAATLADMDINDLETLEEKETWAKINAARARQDKAYEARAKDAIRAYLDARRESGG